MNDEFRRWAADEGLFFGDVKIEEHPITEWAWRAWQRSTTIEREACAKVCEETNDGFDREVRGLHKNPTPESCADAIRMRSNVQAEGAAQALSRSSPRAPGWASAAEWTGKPKAAALLRDRARQQDKHALKKGRRRLSSGAYNLRSERVECDEDASIKRNERSWHRTCRQFSRAVRCGTQNR